MASKARVYRIKTPLQVLVMKEGDFYVAYTPALDFATCGKTVPEAQRMFEEGVKIFLKELVDMGTLNDVLIECGWQKVQHPQPHYEPPSVVASSRQEVEMPCLI